MRNLNVGLLVALDLNFARRALRVQNTVQAQVIPFPQRRRTDGAA